MFWCKNNKNLSSNIPLYPRLSTGHAESHYNFILFKGGETKLTRNVTQYPSTNGEVVGRTDGWGHHRVPERR